MPQEGRARFNIVIYTIIPIIIIVLVSFHIMEDRSDDETPQATMYSYEMRGNFQIGVDSITEAVPGNKISYSLHWKNNGSVVRGNDGRSQEGILGDIYGTPLRNKTTGEIHRLLDGSGNEYLNYITWLDANMDGSLGPKDHIGILGVDNTTYGSNKYLGPGIGTDKMIFKLIYIPNGELIGDVELE